MPQEYVSALGLDIGHKRIGVAGCDRLGLLVTELTTLKRTSFRAVIVALTRLIEERQVTVLVVGMPYTMSGEVGQQAKRVKSFAERLSSVLQLPVEYVDERLTSFQAEQMLIAEGTSPSRNKGLIDQKAAAIILQQWLDQRSDRFSDPLVPSFEPVTGDPE
ncbi:Holliday junction resolvase RuvX [Oscillatoria sp. CS-180]|uniref:Holliday junction resolvase RuvX n=1 Tax=Oscillatoria sp. CS-180 TaxID=3021720 RepID=UPI00232E22AD|nr:Holliday junction resolvase RuvX [Oscillatoria sp. CS-180]MDB9528615.1 Holliday junction resolvase RuvX [Oscillatoria sp. CS-180]